MAAAASLRASLVLAWLAAASASAQSPASPAWTAPTAAQLVPPQRGDGPLLACSAEQLANLRAALTAGAAPVRDRVAAARRRLGQAVAFPPRGGQHNQWYQCDRCQLALTTVDDAHHRCPGCERVYSGPPYDDVVFSRRHGQNCARALDAAWAFALTGERAFAAEAATILLGYADRYRDYEYHSNSAPGAKPNDSGGHLLEQTLSEASLLANTLAPALDLVWPALDDAQRRHVLDDLVAPMVDNVAKCRRGRSNWQSWHNAAMFAGGVLLGDAAWLQRAVLDPRDGFAFQMQRCVSADGMWYENSFGYHLYTLDALAALADAAQRCGVDLFGHPALRAMCALPARYVQGDGLLPRLGDDVGSQPSRAARAFEAAFAATGDARLRAALPATASWDSIRFGREVEAAAIVADVAPRLDLFAASGHALLRGRGALSPTALLTFAPFGGFHDHFDKLSFTFHAGGVERGLDPGRAQSQAYRLPIHRGWYRATLAHDAVVVDGRSQRENGGELLGSVERADYAAVAARAAKAYAGVDHRRCLLLDDELLVVLDVLRGDGEHTFDWLYHDAGDGVECADCATDAPAPLGLAGEEFVAWAQAGDAAGGTTVRFARAGQPTVLALVADGPLHLRTGSGPFRSAKDRRPFVLARRTGGSARFVAVLGVGSVPRLRLLDGDASPQGVALALDRGRGEERIRWDGDGAIDWQR